MVFNFFNVSTFTSGKYDVESFFKTMEKIANVPPRHFNKGAINKQFKTNDFVFVKNKAIKEYLSSTFLGPLKVIERHDRYNKSNFESRPENLSMDRLQLALGVSCILPASITISDYNMHKIYNWRIIYLCIYQCFYDAVYCVLLTRRSLYSLCRLGGVV
uniref:Putative LOC101744432 [Bombyx mori] n=1 Tax=Lepeophtheirus salmonis TaxID=72036 RepID=A0A0K2URH9_LEPSM